MAVDVQPSVPPAVVPLTTLPAGARATLHDVGDAEARGLLRSLGLVGRCTLRVCKAGDPCIVQVRATRIGVSRAVAARLLVVPDHATHA